MIVSPRTTSRRLLIGDRGTLGEVFVWLIVLAATVSPVRTGRAILLGRLALLDGLTVFASHLQVRLLAPLIGVLICAALLTALDRRRPPDRPMNMGRAIDVASFLLVPTLLLTAVGVVLREVSVDVWFLPHRNLRGGFEARAVYLAVGYGWSALLLAGMIFELRCLPKGQGGPSQVDQAPRT